MTHRTQSTPAQKYNPPTSDEHKRDKQPGCLLIMPTSILFAVGFGCMAIALIGAIAGAFK